MSSPDTLEQNSAPLPETVFTPHSALRAPRQLLVELLRDIYQGHPLAWRMFLRDLRGLYRQTLLGLFWAFLPPLANTALWVFLARQGVTDFGEEIGARYPIYVLTGMIFWQSFMEGLMASINGVQRNRHILSKLRFPRESVLMVAMYDTFFNLLIRLAVLLPLLLLYQVSWGPQMLLVPLSATLLVLLGTAVGCLLMPLAMLYQDISRFLLVITPVWMIVTQIVYPPPENLESSPLNWANPASPLLLFSRDLLVLGSTEHWSSAGLHGLLALPLFVLSIIVYRVAIPVLVERVAT